MTKLGAQCANEKTHAHKGGARPPWQRHAAPTYSTNRIPAAMQTRSFSYGAAAVAAARLARVVTGAAVDTVTTAFPVRPTSCLASILRGPPGKGWVKQVLPAVLTTDSSFLPLAVTVSPGFHGTKRKPASVETTMASQHTSPSPLLLTHSLYAQESTYNGRGAC